MYIIRKTYTFCFSIHQSMDIGLFLHFGYQESFCYEHGCTDICLSPYFQSFGAYIQKWNCWGIW